MRSVELALGRRMLKNTNRNKIKAVNRAFLQLCCVISETFKVLRSSQIGFLCHNLPGVEKLIILSLSWGNLEPVIFLLLDLTRSQGGSDRQVKFFANKIAMMTLEKVTKTQCSSIGSSEFFLLRMQLRISVFA